MRISSFFLSLVLHLAVLALALFWPEWEPPIDLNRTSYQVSLVMGDPGGENLPSLVLGARPPVSDHPTVSTELAAPAAPDAPLETAAALPSRDPVRAAPEAAPAPQPATQPQARPAPEIPAPAPPKPVEIPKAPEPAVPAAPPKVAEPSRPREEPQPKPEPDPKPQPKPEPKPEPAPPPTPPKEEPPKRDAPAPRRDPLADALADARRQAGQTARPARPSRGGSSASRALADLEKQVGRTGVGDGGGTGDGPGGGGLYDVYAGLVMMAVRPNWSTGVYSRDNLVVQVRIKLDAEGKVLDCQITRSSGRADFDASAVNAVLRTGALPKPPTPEQQDLLISFNSQQLAGR